MTKWKWGALSLACLAGLSLGAGWSRPANAEVVTYTLAFNPTVGTGGIGTLVLDFASPPTGITILTGTALANDFVSFTETVDGISFTTPLADVSLISLFNTTLTDIVASTTNGRGRGSVTLSEPDLINIPMTYTLGVPFTEFGTISVTNTVTAVPEPSTWVMMILGFLGLAFAASRKRKSSLSFA
jgi:PEP-CTERM motif